MAEDLLDDVRRDAGVGHHGDRMPKRSWERIRGGPASSRWRLSMDIMELHLWTPRLSEHDGVPDCGDLDPLAVEHRGACLGPYLGLRRVELI